MPGDVLVIALARGGAFRRSTHEAIGAAGPLAKALGGRVVALAIGTGIADAAASLAPYGADRILLADHPLLERYSADAAGSVAAAQVSSLAPAAILIPATAAGRDLSATLAARLNAPCATDCIAIEAREGAIDVQRPVYAGKAIARVRLTGRPAIVTTRPNVFTAPPADPSRRAAVEPIPVSLAETSIRTRVIEVQSRSEKPDLTEAPIIVSGGRGMKGPENFPLVERLADALGGVVGASRAVVDAGWRPHSEQVGQTGKVVSPQLYVACGISGAIQHMAGMGTSRVIVAINTDENAPIFQAATYGIVGDVFEVLPRLTEEIRKLA